MSQKHHRFSPRSKVSTHLQGKSHVLCHVTYTHMWLWTTLPLSELGSNYTGAWILPLDGQPVLYGNTLQSLMSHQRTPLLMGWAPFLFSFAHPRAKHGSWSQVGFRVTIYVLLVENLEGNMLVLPLFYTWGNRSKDHSNGLLRHTQSVSSRSRIWTNATPQPLHHTAALTLRTVWFKINHLQAFWLLDL